MYGQSARLRCLNAQLVRHSGFSCTWNSGRPMPPLSFRCPRSAKQYRGFEEQEKVRFSLPSTVLVVSTLRFGWSTAIAHYPRARVQQKFQPRSARLVRGPWERGAATREVFPFPLRRVARAVRGVGPVTDQVPSAATGQRWWTRRLSSPLSDARHTRLGPLCRRRDLWPPAAADRQPTIDPRPCARRTHHVLKGDG